LYDGRLQPIFSSHRYTVKKGIPTKKEFMTISEIIYPNSMFEKNLSEDNDIIEREASKLMGDLLAQICETRSNLQSLGSNKYVDILCKNLNTIEDEIFLNKDGELYKSNLKLNVTWETPF